MMRSPAWAALLLPATTESVNQLGAARATAMTATTILPTQLKILRRIRNRVSTGMKVNANPWNRPYKTSVVNVPLTWSATRCAYQRGKSSAEMRNSR